MRQQFLAHEMERAGELGAERVSLLHLSPAATTGLRHVTSPPLMHPGISPTSIWGKMVLEKDRFAAVDIEALFGPFDPAPFPELRDWYDFLRERYAWFAAG